jgi:magnesium transporter
VSLKRIILSPPATRIGDIYDPDIIAVETYRPAEDVAELMQRYDLDALPVGQRHGRLLAASPSTTW